MMRKNFTKMAMTLLASFSVTVVSLVSFPLEIFAQENLILDQYTEVCNELNAIGEVVDEGYWGDDEWYDTMDEAFKHRKFWWDSEAELKVIWLPIHGWVTHHCTITDIRALCKDGKWTCVYKNSYDGHYYTGCYYE